jgi:anaerobic carbon-monoxide dehydrogenase iron sulfur subunit
MSSRLFTNPDACTGCLNCMAACSQHHFGVAAPSESAIYIEISPFSGVNRPVYCRQCRDAPCAAVCPQNAIHLVESTGAWCIDRDSCVRCGTCVPACPFSAMIWRADAGDPFKCNLCGGEPVCVAACHFSALQYIRDGLVPVRGIPVDDQDPSLGRS